MISFFEYIMTNIRYLLSLWDDSRLTAVIGANFLYLILSIWIFWIMVNLFLIHPNVGGGLFGSIKGSNIKSESRSSRSGSRSSTDNTSDESES